MEKRPARALSEARVLSYPEIFEIIDTEFEEARGWHEEDFDPWSPHYPYGLGPDD
jgi:hypothetical protein